jgi:hypothetical protein
MLKITKKKDDFVRAMSSAVMAPSAGGGSAAAASAPSGAVAAGGAAPGGPPRPGGAPAGGPPRPGGGECDARPHPCCRPHDLAAHSFTQDLLVPADHRVLAVSACLDLHERRAMASNSFSFSLSLSAPG